METNIVSCKQTEYKIVVHTTDHNDITLEIDDFELCCEDFGTRTTFDESFIGAEVTKVRWAWANEEEKDASYESTATIVVVTDRGRFFITGWNYHNGYYPHNVRVSWKDFHEEVEL